MTFTRHLLALGLVLAAPLAAHAADYTVQPASTLGFTGTFQGATFDGTFSKFNATISYDPANLAASKFDVEVDLASARTGDNDRDGALPGPDFFDTSKFPKAHFVTTGIAKTANGVVANGNLTLHGVTKPVALKVTFTPGAGAATLDVSTVLNRLDFSVGGGEYKDTSTIANPVKVNAHLLLQPK
jgi:polyisoprenoid-binding protein YceI